MAKNDSDDSDEDESPKLRRPAPMMMQKSIGSASKADSIFSGSRAGSKAGTGGQTNISTRGGATTVENFGEGTGNNLFDQ